jgi:hypothetical protein
MFSVNSSAVDEVGYENGVLAVRFHNTGTYLHPGVPYSSLPACCRPVPKAHITTATFGENTNEHPDTSSNLLPGRGGEGTLTP